MGQTVTTATRKGGGRATLASCLAAKPAAQGCRAAIVPNVYFRSWRSVHEGPPVVSVEGAARWSTPPTEAAGRASAAGLFVPIRHPTKTPKADMTPQEPLVSLPDGARQVGRPGTRRDTERHAAPGRAKRGGTWRGATPRGQAFPAQPR